jgi:hypothetical protein
MPANSLFSEALIYLIKIRSKILMDSLLKARHCSRVQSAGLATRAFRSQAAFSHTLSPVEE